MLRLPSQLQRGRSRKIDCDHIDFESGMIVKLPWVNLTSPKAGKQQKRKIGIMQYSKSQCVGKCSAHWCNGYVMHNWNSNRRNMEEGETRGASRSKRKYRKATPKKVNNNATMPLYDSKAIAEIAFLRRFTSIPKPCWSFRAGALLNRGFSFLFFLLSRASPPFVSYDMDHLWLWSPWRDQGPSLLVAVETGTRSARIVWCSCFRLRGRKHGYGEHTAWEKPADESNDLCEKTNIKKWKKEMKKGNRKF